LQSSFTGTSRASCDERLDRPQPDPPELIGSLNQWIRDRGPPRKSPSPAQKPPALTGFYRAAIELFQPGAALARGGAGFLLSLL